VFFVFLILSVLLSVNFVSSNSSKSEITDLNRFFWINIVPNYTIRYWVYILLVLIIILWIAYIFVKEIQFYTRLRQHNIATSQQSDFFNTTVLITDISFYLCNISKLKTFYNIYSDSVSNIILNRKYNSLLSNINKRNQLINKFKSAETRLIRKTNFRWQKYILVNNYQYNSSNFLKTWYKSRIDTEFIFLNFVKSSDCKKITRLQFL